jgi:ELWxxDGT repeat protein
MYLRAHYRRGRDVHRRATASACEALETRVLLSLSLVEDINTDVIPVPTSAPVELNGAAYFNRNGALWTSNLATGATTQLAAFSYPPTHLTRVGNSLLFFASNGQYGLWKVDGTSGAVSQVKAITFIESLNQPAPAPAVLGGMLYFTGNGGTGGYELWRSDGTAAGTAIVKDINPGAASSSPSGFTEMGGRLYFAATSPAGVRRLWRTDGTAAGTVRVEDASQLDGPSSPTSLQAVGGNSLYFAATDGTHGNELWKTDGTAAGTKLVQDLVTGSGGSAPVSLTAAGGRLFFVAMDAARVKHLWVTTPAGGADADDQTSMLLGAGFEPPNDPQGLTAFGEKLLFSAGDALSGRELWRSDGTDGGTAPVADLNPGFGSADPTSLVAFGPNVYFAATDGARGYELWRSDGTADGTSLVRDGVPGAKSSRPTAAAVVGGRLVYFARSGSQLWQSDGTEAGTSLLATFPSQPASSIPSTVVPFGDVILFGADDGEGHSGLWKSDGTAEGTVFLAPAKPTVAPVVVADGTVAYFAAKNVLWKTDGSSTGTVPVAQLPVEPWNLTDVNGTVFFVARDADTGEELWRSDGTAGGTFRVKDIARGSTPSYPQWLTNFNGRLFFVAVSPDTGADVWTSDGTAEGTSLLKDLPLAGAGVPSLLTVFNGELFFAASDGETGVELYRSDGTAAGTRRVKDIGPGPGNGVLPSGPPPVVLNGHLYFAGANPANTTFTLWRTDGTEAGTTLVKEVAVERDPHAIQDLVAVNGSLYFTGSRYVGPGSLYRYELWKSDGTPAGTTLLSSDVGLGPTRGFTPTSDGKALFVRSELWQTDGTAAGTAPVPVALGFYSGLVTTANGTILFAGNNAAYGVELWRVDPPGPRPPARPTGLVLTPGRGQVTVSWTDNSGNENGFRVERSATADFATIDHAVTVPPGTTAHTETGLADGVTYYFRLVAVNDAGASAAASASIRAPYAPTAPADLSATPVSGGEVALAWNDRSDNETGFRIERSTAADFSVVERVFDRPVGATSYLDQSAQPGTRYYYRVRAVTPFFESDAVSATAATPAAPRAPTAFVAIAVSGTQVDLRWTDADPGETGYRLERSKSATFDTIDRTFALPPRDGSGGTYTFTDDTAERLTTYFYRLRAFNAAGDSGPAVTSVATPDVVPAKPSPLKAFGVSASEVLLRWADNSDNELSFRIERAEGDAPFVQIAAVPPGRVEYTDFARRPNTTYRYRVRGIGAVGAGPYTDEASATTLPPVLARRVADLNTTSSDVDSAPSGVVTSGGVGYFAAYDENRDRELWRTDGTEAGTYRVKDIDPDGSSNPQYLIDFNGSLLFRTQRGDLWKTDGTAAGTVLLKSAVGLPAPATEPSWSAAFNGSLYFAAGGNLYRTDGTPAGTLLVKSVGVSVGSLTPVANTLFFVGNAPETGAELWKSDGTEAGTTLVKDIRPGEAGASPGSLRALNGVLVFRASAPETGSEIWRSDGTAEGTILLRDIVAGTGSSFPTNIVVIGNTGYFGPGGLWKTDGTPAGTVLVKSVRVTSPLASNGRLYFGVSAGDGLTLYRSDGTTDGTVPVKLIPNTSPFGDSGDFMPIDVNGTLFFLSNHWSTLWRSDGTESGTVPLHTWDPGGGYVPGYFANFKGKLSLTADDGVHGGELWTSDGTVEGTVLVKDVAHFTAGSDPDQFVALNGRALFSAWVGPQQTIFSTDGTGPGTTRLAAGRSPGLAGGWVYFNGFDPARGWELWRTDGTPAGTSFVAELRPGADGMRIGNFTAAGDVVVFSALAEGQGGAAELWRTDGTAAGTTRVSPDVGVIVDTAYPDPPVRPVAVGGTVYFRGTSPTGSYGLWRTDGTAGGTTFLQATSIGELVAFGSSVLFTSGGAHNTLWISDGTPAGTVLLKDANPRSVNSPSINGLAVAGGVAYFSSDEPDSGYGLWKTDGTRGGTVPVASVGDGFPLGAVGGTYYFATFGALYRTDGTAAGTVRIRDYQGGTNAPRYGIVAGGKLFYSDGESLWQSDGTTAGTIKVAAVGKQGPQAFGAGPSAVAVGDSLYVSAIDPVFGSELFTVALGAAPAPPTGLSASPAPGDPSVVRLAWDDRSSDESTFVLERSLGEDFGVIDRSFFPPADAGSFDDAGAAPGGRYYYRIRAVNAVGSSAFSNVAVRPVAVTGRHTFYNGSAFDGGDAAATAADDAAVAPDKRPLLASEAASFRNVTSYAKGVNGVMVDLVGLPADATLTADDFAFRRRAAADGSAWAPGPRPSGVTIRRGAGVNGADRVTLVWGDGGADGAVTDGWLEVTVLANARTGLSRPDVFSFGNLVGETGDGTSLRVNALDLAAVKRALNSPTGVFSVTDFNRDGRTNALDVAALKRALNHSLALPSAALAPAAQPSAEPAPDTRAAPRPTSLLDEDAAEAVLA